MVACGPLEETPWAKTLPKVSQKYQADKGAFFTNSNMYSNDNHSGVKDAVTPYTAINRVISPPYENRVIRMRLEAPSNNNHLVSCPEQKIKFRVKLALNSPLKRKFKEDGVVSNPSKRTALKTTNMPTSLVQPERMNFASGRNKRPLTPPVSEPQTVFKPLKAQPKQKRDREDDEGCAEHPSKVICQSHVRSFNQRNEIRIVHKDK